MKKIIFLFFILLIVSAGVFAETLDLERARKLALANSSSLKKYDMAIRSSVLDERNQLYSMLPSVSASYNASMYYLRDWRFKNPVDTFTTGASLSITQLIFDGGKIFIQKAISAIATESVRIDAQAEFFRVLDEVDNAYYAALESAATLEAAESSLKAAELALAIAEIRHANGMINQGDYLKAMADKETLENSRNQARRSISLAMAKLKILTGLEGTFEPEQINFDAYDDLLPRLSGISDEEADALFEELWKLIAESNPSLAKAVLANQRAEKNYSISKRDYAPTISATVFQMGLGYSTANGFNNSSSGGVTISGSIPVDFWVLNNRREKNKITYDSAMIDFTNAGIQLETDLQTAVLDALSQAGSVLSSRRSLQYTETHFEFVMERYRLSQSSVSELSDASSSLINSRNSLIRASYSFLRSLSRLRSMGAVSDEEVLIKILLGN